MTVNQIAADLRAKDSGLSIVEAVGAARRMLAEMFMRAEPPVAVKRPRLRVERLERR